MSSITLCRFTHELACHSYLSPRLPFVYFVYFVVNHPE